MIQHALSKFLLALWLFPLIAIAQTPSWKIIPTESSLTFTAIQNDAPVTGKFTHFSGEINFDPKQLSQSQVKIMVDVGSISDAYNELSDTLKMPDWFNVKVFSQAIFQSNTFMQISDKKFQAKGNLLIRDKTLPVILNFTQEEYSDTKAVMKGSTMIKRSAFGVGQGEWADTKTVKDEVQINFLITAVRK